MGVDLCPDRAARLTRRDFIRRAGLMGAGLAASPAIARWVQGSASAAEMSRNGAVRAGKAQHITILHVRQVGVHDVEIHRVLTEYLAANSRVAPVIEGRAVATDAPADLLSQIAATGYSFR